MASSRWAQAVEDTGLPTLLDEIDGHLSYLAERLDPAQLAELRRIRLVHQLAKARIAGRNAEGIPPGTLQPFADAIRNTRDALQGARNAADAGEYVNLSPINDNTCNAVLNVLAQMPPGPSRHREGEVVAGLEADAQAVLSGIQGDVRELSSQLDSTVQDLAAKRAEAERAFSTTVDGLNQGIEAAKAEFSSAVAANKSLLDDLQARADSLITTQQTSFQEQLDRQSESLQTALSDSRKEFDSWLGEAKTKAGTEAEATAASAQALIAEIKKMKTHAEELVQVIGVEGLAAGYQKNADKEEKTARKWRYTAMAFGGLAATALIVAAVLAHGSNATWLSFAAKSAVTAVLLTVAAYAAALAGHHDRRASQCRNRELALASLPPYLDGLEDEDIKQELLRQLAIPFFTKLDEDESKKSKDFPTQVSFLESLIEQLVGKIPGKSG